METKMTNATLINELNEDIANENSNIIATTKPVEQLKPSNYFKEDIDLLKARMKKEVKNFSHNELARQYVDLYTTLVVLNKDYMELQKVLRNKEQLESLLNEATKLAVASAANVGIEPTNE
jgi:hypothetical protein